MQATQQRGNSYKAQHSASIKRAKHSSSQPAAAAVTEIT